MTRTEPPLPGAATVPAAAYARMSRDVQQYSVQHQLDCIQAYAAAGGLAVVRTFVDEGRSGLSLENRPGLRALLAEATGAACAFSVIVVYDVSRWGRFQDTDESAFYEHLCRRAGVSVVYCAEQFVNDGSPMVALMKSVKRIMAAEYSRELGVKVHLAQCRFSRMGYKQGGLPGFGLRRLAVAADGQIGAQLRAGQRKPGTTDRVTLVHGTADEVALVRRIFRLYTEEGWNDTRIAAQLRAEGRINHLGKSWDPNSVRRILINGRYCGEIVYNQTTRRLRGPVTRNPERLWIRCDGALAPMVTRAAFETARRIRAGRASGPEREDVLELLRALHRRHGAISAALCVAAGLPGRETMRRLFGGYVAAYAAAGLPPQHTEAGALGVRTMRTLVEAMLARVTEKAERAGATVHRTRVWNVLLLNQSLTVKVSIASCRCYPGAWHRWRVPLTAGSAADFVLCALMDTANAEVSRYLLLASGEARGASVYLSERTVGRYARHCFASLDEVFGLASGGA
ncbi:recombinase family protein [Pseudoduganella namucuonensis]|uniref:Site-specific DNA recombinase n=1 Tax=Pseudoduganella namucuonensis TaxID=1035707 RepID=A0A1I7M7Q7_9BURK|nr:recombinase family protein [Pseudoduganella namucuonensis]SFV17966.1 Site-specific DNA recombinase [Pseudoduganella namucuonensis]